MIKTKTHHYSILYSSLLYEKTTNQNVNYAIFVCLITFRYVRVIKNKPIQFNLLEPHVALHRRVRIINIKNPINIHLFSFVTMVVSSHLCLYAIASKLILLLEQRVMYGKLQFFHFSLSISFFPTIL